MFVRLSIPCMMWNRVALCFKFLLPPKDDLGLKGFIHAAVGETHPSGEFNQSQPLKVV